MSQPVVFVPMREDGINAVLHLLKDAIAKNRQGAVPMTGGKRERELHLLSTIRNDLQGSRRGFERIRTQAYPVTDVKEWTTILTALLADPSPEAQLIKAKIERWLESCTYNPAAPEEQAARESLKGKIRQGIVLAKFPVEDILPLIQMVGRKKDAQKVELAGHKVNVSSKRLQTFKLHGTKCALCGLEGKYFALEYFASDNHGKEHPHLNLYGEEEGKPVLMTHDHIIPKVADGPDTLDNMRTLCYPCNMTKGGRLDAE